MLLEAVKNLLESRKSSSEGVYHRLYRVGTRLGNTEPRTLSEPFEREEYDEVGTWS